ncbi:FAD-dependent monooxygenase [Pseudonocardia kongjuensis]|uniref:FAD-dependent monooxygenase n=1 Tax=Pseudonocardia kongjuensis TaxID=102227 RepID=A0ABN1YDI6_9PSEU
MRVVVAGGGIGGLALAQGLHHNGIEVVVHDRDPRPECTGGYRLHLDDGARSALARLLPPPVLQAVLASAGGGTAFHRFTVTDHRLRALTTQTLPAGDRLMIGRIPLRTLLAHDLDVRWGSSYTGHTTIPDGRVRAEFIGGPEIGDVLVGADGAGSALARALAGRPLSAPTGIEGLAGRIPLDDDLRGLLPDALRHGPLLALGPGGLGLFLSVHDPASSPVAASSCTAPPAMVEPASLVCGPMLPAARFPVDPRGSDGPDLVALTGELLRGWHPDLCELAGHIDPASTAHFRFLAADPDADPTPWPVGRVTALGDAVHAMPPTGGRGAATAIRDADVLARELVRARDGATTVPLALLTYQREMAAYGPAAVGESLVPLTWLRRLAGRTGTAALHAAGAAAGLRARACRPWRDGAPPRLRTGRSRTARPA